MIRIILIIALFMAGGGLVEYAATEFEKATCMTDTECEAAYGISVEESWK